MTLDELYQKVVGDIGEDTDTLLAMSAGAYTDTVSFNRIRSELNRAARKIARKKLALSYVEDITIDADLMFVVTLGSVPDDETTPGLTKTFLRIMSLVDADGEPLPYERVSTTQYKVPDAEEADVVTLTYAYIPTDMSALTDELDLPEGDIDHDIVCYWADFMWFKIDGNSRKANTFLELWNDGFEDEIDTTRGETSIEIERWW